MSLITDMVVSACEPVMSMAGYLFTRSVHEQSKAALRDPQVQELMKQKSNLLPESTRNLVTSYLKELGVSQERFVFTQNEKAKQIEGCGTFQEGDLANFLLSSDYIAQLEKQNTLTTVDKFKISQAVAQIHNLDRYSGIITIKETAAKNALMAYAATAIAITIFSSPPSFLVTHLVSCAAADFARSVTELALSEFQKMKTDNLATILMLKANCNLL